MKRLLLSCIIMILCFINVIEAQNNLKVMTFNKLYSTSNNSVLNVIQSSGADVIGIQEAFGSARSVANSLGFYYHSISNSEAIISRYPITSTNSSGIQITLPDGLEVYVFNAHLTSYPYEPYEIRDRDITSESAAINSANRTRGAEMRRLINTIQNWVPEKAPVFLTGDFNEPSHLDWTQRAANAGVHAMKVAWPTSTQATNAGMKDSWRTIYSNEVSKPGDTWTPIRSSREVYDRIDFVYHRGENVIATKAVRYGPNNDEAEVNLRGYTSDHRAMMVTYSIPNTGGDGGGTTTDYGNNLLDQNSAEESNLDSWIQVSGNNKRVQGGRDGYPTAKEGNYIFWFGTSSKGEVYQEVNVQKYAGSIDEGNQMFLLEGFIRSYSGRDNSRIQLEFRDRNNLVLDSFDSNWKSSSNWEQIKKEKIAPVGTRIIRVVLLSQRNSGRSNDGYIDALSLKAKKENVLMKRQASINKMIVKKEENVVYKVWPNPASNYINFDFNKNVKGEISIINMLGVVKKKIIINNFKSNIEISISDLSKGFFTFQFINEKGNIYKKTFIVK